jgi:pectinesterase
LALSAYATNQGYYGCKFTGYQDTVLAETGNQVYAKCLIQGAIDFIFGQHATAWFDSCDIKVVSGPSEGTITANGRSSSSDPSYYVIHKSTISAASGNSVGSGVYYLGKLLLSAARREHAAVA